MGKLIIFNFKEGIKMNVKKYSGMSIIFLIIIFTAACQEKEIKSFAIQFLNGEIYSSWDEDGKNEKEEFFHDFSLEPVKLDSGLFWRPPMTLKIDIIGESDMKGKSALQVINEVKNNFEVNNQAIYYYIQDEKLKFYAFFLSFEMPYYLEMVQVLLYFDNEYTLENRYLYRSQLLSDSSEIKRISNILANEYNYEILQRTFIESKD